MRIAFNDWLILAVRDAVADVNEVNDTLAERSLTGEVHDDDVSAMA